MLRFIFKLNDWLKTLNNQSEWLKTCAAQIYDKIS